MTGLAELTQTSPMTNAQVADVFSTLPAVAIEELIGTWTAVAIPGVLPAYEPLIAAGWYGMRFHDRDTVDSLLISSADGREQFAADALKMAALGPDALTLEAGTPRPSAHLSRIRDAIQTPHPSGRLRMIEHRGIVTCALIYDRQPVIDYFRHLDDDAVVCAAEARGHTELAYCVLRRVRTDDHPAST